MENFSPFPGLTNHSTTSQELLCFLQWQCLVGDRLSTRTRLTSGGTSKRSSPCNSKASNRHCSYSNPGLGMVQSFNITAWRSRPTHPE